MAKILVKDPCAGLFVQGVDGVTKMTISLITGNTKREVLCPTIAVSDYLGIMFGIFGSNVSFADVDLTDGIMDLPIYLSRGGNLPLSDSDFVEIEFDKEPSGFHQFERAGQSSPLQIKNKILKSDENSTEITELGYDMISFSGNVNTLPNSVEFISFGKRVEISNNDLDSSRKLVYPFRDNVTSVLFNGNVVNMSLAGAENVAVYSNSKADLEFWLTDYQ